MARILIADDDSDMCETMSDILTACGHTVRTVQDGPTALEAARHEHYDVALIDQRMPAVAGLTIVRHLRETRACDDIYIITAYADRGFARRAALCGATRVFVKPLDIPLVLGTIVGASDECVSAEGVSRGTGGAFCIEGLTRRELQVLALIAQGKHNREIAAELSLSVRTVERHVSEILTRLGISTRSAAAAVAIRHHLV